MFRKEKSRFLAIERKFFKIKEINFSQREELIKSLRENR